MLKEWLANDGNLGAIHVEESLLLWFRLGLVAGRG